MRRLIGCLSALLVMLSSVANAAPTYARLYKQQYGYVPTCNACHSDGGGSALGGFGKAFKTAGKNLSSFAAIAAADSDGDGVANGVEAQSKSNPNDKTSTPTQAGPWLDNNGAIPKEVQALFPGVLDWMPRDATLSPADLATAKSMGATLTAADENTIYIPVQNKRPAGTALIFPVVHAGKSFYLLMTTDATKELKITQLQLMNAKSAPAAQGSNVYAQLVGTSSQSVPTAKGGSLDAAITQAVKNAGTLLFLRLKGS
jgi:hypothetical protein